ncbi:hypothetical protein BX265_4944 [Streptomyces sp. TLI_235]|nr:hypothetical protein [Streptomyces sp. TLI_235]PBC80108.1 hypothetical protein BX265_4944 [Streptomyces sp. TLI_235]
MNVGELTATFDVDPAGAEAGIARSEVLMRGLERDANQTATSIRRDMDAALRRLPTMRITADSSDAEREFNEVRHAMRDLAAERVGVTISAEEAGTRLDALQDRLLALARQDISPQVNLGTRQAFTVLETLQGRLDEMAREDVAVEVHTNAQRAQAELARVAAEAEALGRVDPEINVRVDEDREVDRAERDFSRLSSMLGSVAGSLGGVAGQAAMTAGQIGAAVPVLAGVVATLVSIAPAAGVAVSGLLAVASAAAAIKIGTSGIGSAIKAAFADAPAAAGGAAKAANGFANAQRAVKDAVRQAADANERAAQQVASAERNLTDAQKSALSAQNALTDARRQAAMDLEDLNNRLADSALGQREAVLRVQDAQQNLNKVLADKSASQQQREEAQLAYDLAVQHLKEQGLGYKRLQDQAAQANAAGVDGSKKVIDAQDKLALAQRNVGDQTRAVADAQKQQARTAQQGAEQIQRAMEAMQQAGAGAAGGGVDPLAAALAKLTPNARAFVEEIIRLKPALADLKFDVQQRLFDGLAGSLRTAAGALLPTLHSRLVDTAGVLNTMAKGAFDAAANLGSSGILGQALDSANRGLGNLSRVPGQLVTGLGQIGAAAGPAFERLTAGAGGVFDKLAGAMSKAFASGGMTKAIDTAIDLIGQLATVVGNVGSIIGSVMGAAQQTGGSYVATLVKISDAAKTAFASPAVQGGLQALFGVMSTLASTAAPLLTQALMAVGPVLSALAPGANDLVKALGDALGPIIKALGPVLQSAAQAVSELASAVSPLLPVIGDLIAMLGPAIVPIFKAFAEKFRESAPVVKQVADVISSLLKPILAELPSLITPLMDIWLRLNTALLPVFSRLLTELQPSLKKLGDAFVDIMRALEPVLKQFGELLAQSLPKLVDALGPVISTVGKLAGIFAGELARQVQTVVVPALRMVSQLLKGDLHGAFDSLGDVVKGALGTVVRLMINLPYEILKAVGDLGRTLWNAGTKLIDGLIDGIKSKLSHLGDVLGGIGDYIKEHKGPPAYDAIMLTPAGQSIMDGLMRGIAGRLPALRGQLAGITGEISGLRFGGAFGGTGLAMAGGRGADGFHIEHYHEAEGGSARATAEELSWLSKGRG